MPNKAKRYGLISYENLYVSAFKPINVNYRKSWWKKCFFFILGPTKFKKQKDGKRQKSNINKLLKAIKIGLKFDYTFTGIAEHHCTAFENYMLIYLNETNFDAVHWPYNIYYTLDLHYTQYLIEKCPMKRIRIEFCGKWAWN